MSEDRNNGLELLIGGLLCFGGGYHFGKKKGYEEGHIDGFEEAEEEFTRQLMLGGMRNRAQEDSYIGKHSRRK